MGVKSLKSMHRPNKGYVHVIVCVCGHFKSRHQGTEKCGGIILKGSYTAGIKADVSVSTTRAFLPPYHVGKREYTRLAHVSDTSTSHHDYMRIGSRLHANRQDAGIHKQAAA